MKLVTAIIQPFKLDEVREALTDAGVQGMTITEAQDFSFAAHDDAVYSGCPRAVNVVARIKLELLVADGETHMVTETLEGAAACGDGRGNARVVVTEVTRVIRIRTAEEDAQAI